LSLNGLETAGRTLLLCLFSFVASLICIVFLLKLIFSSCTLSIVMANLVWLSDMDRDKLEVKPLWLMAAVILVGSVTKNTAVSEKITEQSL